MNTKIGQQTANTFTNSRLLHAMLRVGDLEKSLRFYTEILGMRVFRREEYPQGKFTLVFLGYQGEEAASVLELTHNWDTDHYEIGGAYGHIAIATENIYASCEALVAAGVRVLKEPGPMMYSPSNGGEPDVIAFIEDPDGYRIELIQIEA